MPQSHSHNRPFLFWTSSVLLVFLRAFTLPAFGTQLVCEITQHVASLLCSEGVHLARWPRWMFGLHTPKHMTSRPTFQPTHRTCQRVVLWRLKSWSLSTIFVILSFMSLITILCIAYSLCFPGLHPGLILEAGFSCLLVQSPWGTFVVYRL